MKYLLALFCLYLPLGLLSQSPPQANGSKQTLKERYQLMKSSSQTFKEYKVIKEVELESEWKIFLDSVAGVRNQWREAKSTITTLEAQLNSAKTELLQKEDSMAKIEHAANHIDFFGMDFNKAAFVVIVVTIFGVLMVLLGMVMGRLKIMFKEMREKNEIVGMITREFEDYKHKMLDKQTKLSRELQNERNKLQEIKRN